MTVLSAYMTFGELLKEDLAINQSGKVILTRAVFVSRPLFNLKNFNLNTIT
jgi:hypothetical protein